MVQRLLLGARSSPTAPSPPPVKMLQVRPQAGSRQLPCPGEPEGPASSMGLEPAASFPPCLSIEAPGRATMRVRVHSGWRAAVRPWRVGPPLGLTVTAQQGAGPAHQQVEDNSRSSR